MKQVAAAAKPFLSGALCLHCLGGQTLLCFKCFIVQVKLSLVCVPQKFPIKERPVETNLLTFI